MVACLCSENQEWKIHFGTLAFEAKTCFAAAVVEAYKQRTWLTVKDKAINIGVRMCCLQLQMILAHFQVLIYHESKNRYNTCTSVMVVLAQS